MEVVSLRFAEMLYPIKNCWSIQFLIISVNEEQYFSKSNFSVFRLILNNSRKTIATEISFCPIKLRSMDRQMLQIDLIIFLTSSPYRWKEGKLRLLQFSIVCFLEQNRGSVLSNCVSTRGAAITRLQTAFTTLSGLEESWFRKQWPISPRWICVFFIGVYHWCFAFSLHAVSSSVTMINPLESKATRCKIYEIIVIVYDRLAIFLVYYRRITCTPQLRFN